MWTRKVDRYSLTSRLCFPTRAFPYPRSSLPAVIPARGYPYVNFPYGYLSLRAAIPAAIPARGYPYGYPCARLSLRAASPEPCARLSLRAVFPERKGALLLSRAST